MKHFIPRSGVPVTSIPTVIGPEEYVQLLHPAEMRGWPCVMGKSEASTIGPKARSGSGRVVNRCMAPETLQTVLPSWLEGTSFLSLNRFFKRRRTRSLMSLNAIYVDLDFRAVVAWRGKSADEVQVALERHCLSLGLPEPSFIIQTGRGLAAIWLIKPMPPQALARWRAAIRALIDLWKGFGADRSCSDVTRVFRIPGTINEKNGQEVRVTGGSLQRYSFDALEDQIYIASGRPTRRQLEARRKARKKQRRQKEQMPKGLSPAQRFEQIQQDLEKIAEAYGGQMPEGTRNTWLHLFGACLTHQNDPGDVEAAIEEAAARVTPGLDESDVDAIARQASEMARLPGTSNPLKDGRYHYSGHAIADLLGVTGAMVRDLGLRQVVPLAERRKRKAEAQRARRASAGAVSREAWLAQNDESRTQPWRRLGIGRTKYYRLKKEGLLGKLSDDRRELVRARYRGVAGSQAPTGDNDMSPQAAHLDHTAQPADNRPISRETSGPLQAIDLIMTRGRPSAMAGMPAGERERKGQKRRERTCGPAIPPGASPKGVLPCSTVTTPLSPRSRPFFTATRRRCRTQPCFWVAGPLSRRPEGFSMRSAHLRRSRGAYGVISESCMRSSRWSMCMTPSVRKQPASRRSTRHGRASRRSVCSRTNSAKCSMRSYRPKH